ncbi:ATP-dependent RNA helicase eIF4A [Tritrichomonas foetus]|uniref:ATP-dependent RNA helicase eIF4A n=1 Tax=Tritrichomonas foetus TaxID=1144522 RepID=A0A1J4JQM0_9EUKA|nr:ATP-dependent RNA helicase eIF4A [Tritrichomonas foetus]|eukprot:OHS99811.1 ATP-dependent RNA helicase eIF4A [Tritrichomonas foetus]
MEGNNSGYRGSRGRGRGRGSSRGGSRYRGNPTVAHDNPNFEANWDERVDDFDQMDLKPELLHDVFSYGFKHPSEIQALAIKPIELGRNVIAQAQSGTGKTGAFSIGILQNIDLSEQSTQALVLAPTRELADQIYTFFAEIGARMVGLNIVIFKGGVSEQENQQQAQQLPHIVIATPGRALSLIQKGFLRCENLRLICLDEADALLDEGFVAQVQEIFSFLNPGIQILLFSATIPAEIFGLMEQFMTDPVKILVKAEKLTLEGIRQFYVNVNNTDFKFPTLLDIYGQLSIQKAVIFANKKETVDYLQKQFEAENFDVSAIHGGLEQSERERIMQQFRVGNARVLVATDLIGRGIDVQQITLVINFEAPPTRELYLHRIGRSGRYGRKGVAINICDVSEMTQMHDIMQFYRTKIDELPSDFAEILKEANDSIDQSND